MSIERRLKRKNNRKGRGTMSEAIKISEKAAGRMKELLEASQRLNEQISTYVQGLAAGMDVPDGWQLDPRAMAFVAPPAPPAPEPTEGAGDATE